MYIHSSMREAEDGSMLMSGKAREAGRPSLSVFPSLSGALKSRIAFSMAYAADSIDTIVHLAIPGRRWGPGSPLGQLERSSPHPRQLSKTRLFTR